jgi:cyclic peptide transporter
MRLLQFLRRELIISPWIVLFLACISGISNALILIIINTAANQSLQGSNLIYILLFIIVIGIYIISQRHVLTTTSKAIDTILHKIRLRIVEKIQNAEFLTLEQIGRSEVYNVISKEMQTISNTAMAIVILGQSALLILFTLAYIAWLSLAAFMIFAVFIMGAIFLYLLKMNELKTEIHESTALENELLDAMTHLLDGFKEVKMSERRSMALKEHIRDISTSVVDVRGNVTTQMSIVNIYAQTSFYILVALVLFILPQLSLTSSDMLAKISAGVLFLTGPISTLVSSVQVYATANVAAENIEHLEAALDRQVRPMAQRRAGPLVIPEPFGEITFEHVEFTYVDKEGNVSFRFGPTDLSISRGETIFITGANGSGKSTFVYLLTALYFPTRGVLRLDGQPVSEANAGAYRNLFSAIFYDFHLFDRLYGLHDIGLQQVEALLERFQLRGKTRLVDSRFETLDLSSGQRRRLALLVSYLENKPINVFDEWAAEQDPSFRRYFYTDILAELKASGKTVIAVTHDDRYYDMAYVDRILKFEEGQLVPYSAPPTG